MFGFPAIRLRLDLPAIELGVFSQSRHHAPPGFRLATLPLGLRKSDQPHRANRQVRNLQFIVLDRGPPAKPAGASIER